MKNKHITNQSEYLFGNNPYFKIEGEYLIITQKRTFKSELIHKIELKKIHQLTYQHGRFVALFFPLRILAKTMITLVYFFIGDRPESFSPRLLVNYELDGEKAATEFDAKIHKTEWEKLRTILAPYPIELIRESD